MSSTTTMDDLHPVKAPYAAAESVDLVPGRCTTALNEGIILTLEVASTTDTQRRVFTKNVNPAPITTTASLVAEPATRVTATFATTRYRDATVSATVALE